MTITSGPHFVVDRDVPTGIFVRLGDTIRTRSTGKVDFGGAVVGIGAPILDADGDGWQTPSNYPAPTLRKNSLVWKAGNTWHQGGVDVTQTALAAGEVILNCNDGAPGDNTRGWSVDIDHTFPNPPPVRPTGVPSLDIFNVEGVQAIQRFDNSVRLVTGKRTMVRVSVDSGFRDGSTHGAGPDEQPDVRGLLNVFDARGLFLGSGVPLFGNVVTARPSPRIDRNDITHTLNFEIPPAALRDVVRLEATAWVAGHESDPPASGWSAQRVSGLEFQVRPQQRIIPILIRDDKLGTALPTPADFTGSMRGPTARFPIADADFIIDLPRVLAFSDLDLRTLEGWSGLLARVKAMAITSTANPPGIRAGIIAATAPLLNGIGGGGGPPAFVAKAGLQGTFAHEMGHVFDIDHAPCCTPAGTIDPRLPAVTDDVGVDVAGGRVIVSGSGEIMSYCGDTSLCPSPTSSVTRWPSTAFWDLMFGKNPV